MLSLKMRKLRKICPALFVLTLTLGLTANIALGSIEALAQTKGPLPDLKIVNLRLSRTTLSIGDRSIDLEFLLRNAGPGPADLRERVPVDGYRNNLVIAYAKQNGTGPDTPQYASSFLHGASTILAAGATRSYSWSLLGLPIFPAGRHALCVVADPDNLLRETNELNNRLCANYTVVAETAQPDLTIPELSVSPTAFVSGATVAIKLSIRNGGTGLAPGTLSAGANGYMIDLTMGIDQRVPGGFAVYNATYREDVLLRGGRDSRTTDLAPGASKTYFGKGFGIPAGAKPGLYYICAYADAGLKVAESNEANNTRCTQIRVAR